MAGALTAAIAAAFSGVTADPYYEYTTLLLPGSGTNGAQNNTFLDGSTNNFTITRNGNTTQGTFSPFSQTGWGNYFVANNANALTAATGSGVAFGVGDFCQEFFLYATSYTGTWRIISYASVSATASMLIQSGAVLSLDTGVGSINTGITLPTNTWFHLVYTRQSSRIRIFVNGVLQYNVADATNYTTSQSVYIGGFPGFTQSWDGYISNARIIKGSVPTAYQTSSTTNGTTIFTPPTSPLTADTGTELLTCQSNRFFDSNTQVTAKTITVSGSPRVVAFSPFNPTASWSAATYGGSGYFDGSGDYLSVANNAALSYGTGAFTIEGFFYTSATNQYGSIFSDENSSGTAGLTLLMNPTVGNGQLVLYGNGALLVTATGKYNDNAWHHFAISRDSTNLRLYVDGVYIGASASGSTNFDASQPLFLMTSPIAGRTISGYLSSFRTIKGTALYTGISSITVPTAPLTAITNTSLLLNFTNAGIYDATSKNDLETVGDAQISNTTAKFGSTSIATGTNNYLKTPDNSLFDLGAGAWTIEFWAYTTAWASAYNVIVCQWNVSTAFIVRITSTLIGLYANIGGTQNYTASVTNSLNNWDYYAITRSGNTLTFYKNNSSVGTASITGTINNSTEPITIGVLGDNNSTTVHSGYIQDLRITLGTARTITAAPTAAFPTL